MRVRVMNVLAVATLLGALPPPAAWSGAGSIQNGKVNIGVLFAYEEADPDAWRPVFEEASRLLYNASNGQLQLGRIELFTCAGDRADADFWILDTTGGAFANVFDPVAGTGLGGNGHVYLTQTHRSSVSPALGQFGVVHELGHYALGLFDEYDGITQPARGFPAAEMQFRVPNQFCVTDLDPAACLMDGGTTVSPNNARTEFCTLASGGLSTAHNEGTVAGGLLYVNAQQVLNGESCWETISRLVGLAQPTSVVTSDPPGLEPITWVPIENRNRVVICIDRSGSLTEQTVALARSGALQLIDLLHERRSDASGAVPTVDPGQELAVTAFATSATTEFPLTEIVGDSEKDAARAAVEEMSIGGRSTSLATGLLSSLDQFLSAGPDPVCRESIVLMSDGFDNIGPDPLSVLSAVTDRGAKLYTVALGESANVELLQTLATTTGGEFFQAVTAEDLDALIAGLSGSLRSDGTIVDTGDLTSGENHTAYVLVDSFSEEVTAVLNWDEGTLDMALTSPSGEVFTVESAATNPDVDAERRGDYVYIRVFGPEQGEWQVGVEAVEVPDVSEFDLSVLADARPVSITVTTDQDSYSFPGPVRVRCDVIAAIPVAGCAVTAVVDRPAGEDETIRLYDDGDLSHGDAFANDGVYNAIFDRFQGSGLYTFHVQVTNENGTGPDPSLPFIEEGIDPTPPPVAPFVREAEVSVLVRNVPGIVPSDLDFSPRTLNVNSNGGSVTCYIEIEAPHSATEIDLATLRLNGAVEPRPDPTSLGDHDGDGVPDLMVKFPRQDVIQVLPLGMSVEVRVSGSLTTGEPFTARDEISVFDPGALAAASVSPETVAVGGELLVTWEPVEGESVFYNGFISYDNGGSWTGIFGPVQGETSYSWTVSGVGPGSAHLMVEACDVEGTLQRAVTNPIVIVDGPVSTPAPGVRTEFLRATPNPVQGWATLEFSLAAAERVSLEIFDVTGRRVRSLVSEVRPAGVHHVTWDGRDTRGRATPSGTYLYRFETSGSVVTGRLTIVR